MGILKLIFGFAGGPAAWLATAVSWVTSAFAWCVAHWQIVLAAVVAAGLYIGGHHYGSEGANATWQAKWTDRDKRDQLAADAHDAVITARDGAIASLDAAYQKAKAVRANDNKRIDEEVRKYVEAHSQPAAPGTCPTDTDIGDDGLQLIERARAARHD